MMIERPADIRYKRLLDVIPDLVDDRTGIITSVEEAPRQEDMPALFYYIARGSDTSRLVRSGYAPTTAGVSADRVAALCKAVGECIERYCGSIFHGEDLMKCNYNALTDGSPAPSDYALLAEKQYKAPGFPLQRFDESTVIRWVDGQDMTHNQKVMLPAPFVYVPYALVEGEAKIWLPGSTGLAAHCTYEEAVLSGTLEVIERDCFSLTWQAGMRRPVIARESLTDEHLETIALFEDLGYHISLADIRNETRIPAILGILSSDGSGNLVRYALSASAHPDPGRAVQKCLEELCLIERYARRAMLTTWQGTGDDFNNIRSFFDHVRLYNMPEFSRHAAFLIDSSRQVRIETMTDFSTGVPSEDLEIILKLIRRSGYRVCTADVTTEDVARLGLFVVRSIIPGYHPHLPGFAMRVLGGHRLWTIPQKLGYEGIDPESGDYPFPHPFA